MPYHREKVKSPYGNNEPNRQNILLARIRELESLCITQQAIINNFKSQNEELAYEILWTEGILSNPILSDNEKVKCIGYYQYAITQQKREDGSFYYSRFNIAERVGNAKKVQAVSDVHSRLQTNGYIKTYSEPQKHDKNKQNHFDILLLSFLSDPKSISLNEHSLCGGKRIAIHKDCGGVCTGRMIYLCSRCGEDHIEERNITQITEEEFANRIDFEQKLPSMRELDDFEPDTSQLADMPHEENRDDIEAFHRAMHTVKNAPKRQKYGLNADIALPYTEVRINIDEPRRGPPNSS